MEIIFKDSYINDIYMEQWKQIKFLPKYECSNLGQIRNAKTKKILKQNKTHSGYLQVNICKKSYSSHRIVAETFITKQEGTTVDHIDKNKENNNINNLRWATSFEQSKNRNVRKNINNKIKIDKYDMENKYICTYNSLIEAGKSINDNAFKNISSCIRGKSKSAYNFIWKINFQNIDGEQWEKIDKHPDFFISNMGRIKHNYKLLNGIIHHSGYVHIQIEKKFYMVHRLVAIYFNENPNNYNIVNHKDGKKDNNIFTNLEWTNDSGNAIHAIETNLRKIKKICNIDDNGNVIKIYRSCMHASKELNVNCSSINKCCNGIIKSCGKGLKFRFLEKDGKLKIEYNNIKTNIRGIPHKINVYKNNQLIETCQSIMETHRKYFVNPKTIKNHCDGKIKYSHKDLSFKYNE